MLCSFVIFTLMFSFCINYFVESEVYLFRKQRKQGRSLYLYVSYETRCQYRYFLVCNMWMLLPLLFLLLSL